MNKKLIYGIAVVIAIAATFAVVVQAESGVIPDGTKVVIQISPPVRAVDQFSEQEIYHISSHITARNVSDSTEEIDYGYDMYFTGTLAQFNYRVVNETKWRIQNELGLNATKAIYTNITLVNMNY